MSSQEKVLLGGVRRLVRGWERQFSIRNALDRGREPAGLKVTSVQRCRRELTVCARIDSPEPLAKPHDSARRQQLVGFHPINC